MANIATRIANHNKKLRKDRRKAIITTSMKRIKEVLYNVLGSVLDNVHIVIPCTVAVFAVALLIGTRYLG